MPLTLQDLNNASQSDFVRLLDGTYEHSPWIVERSFATRPFASLAALKLALVEVVRDAGREAQLELIRAHPELAGKAMVSKTLTAESTHEQGKAGLTDCTPEEFAKIQRLNADYNAKFGFPFILAVRGPRGTGLTKAEIIATFERRLDNHPDFELAECLRNIHRIAELRLDDKFGHEPALGNLVWDWAERLASNSDPGYAERGELTVTYLTDAHRAVAQRLAHWMRADCGFDEVEIDAVGNVVGVYHGSDPNAKRLLTGSHYDTVRNGGKYDGRLGILVPMACVRELSRAERRLPYGFEVVGFAEEEGQRYKAVFLGSGALTGHFDPAWLDQADADGVTMRQAMTHAGLCIDDIPKLQRDASKYLGFVEVHIEQGPVLNELDLPLGIVTSINGSVRYVGEVIGMASHAGTTPMDRRRDAAAAVAELLLYLEKRAAAEPHLVGTVGMLEVPNGSINVVPGRCKFSLDIRATTNEVRDACTADTLAELERICERRGLHYRIEETVRAAAAPSAPAWQRRWERAVESLGLPLHPHAERRRTRRDEAARGDAAGDAVPARPQLGHQPQPTRKHHQRRHRALRASVPDAARATCRRSAMNAQQRLDAWIDAHFDDEVRFLQELVRVPTDTPPGNNAPHAERTAELLAGLGLHAEKHAVPAERVREYGLQSITNLIVRRRYGDGGPTDGERPGPYPVVALNAHGDVVPPGDGWTHDPYGGEVVDGKLYGRAAAVSKSDFATYTFALRALESLGAPLKGAVELHFTYDEEFGGELGPGWLLSQGLTKPDLLVAAGFSYQVVTAHNGCLQLEVTVHGVMAHAAIPESGVDALQGATAILTALYACNRRYREVRSQVPGITHPYLNVGRIEGGTNTNVVPGKVTLKLDRRMIPEEDPAAVEAELRRVIADAAASLPGIKVEIRRLLLAHAWPPSAANRPLVQALQRQAEAVFGCAIPATGTPLYTDVRLYGAAGVPAAIYGAGPRTVLESNAKRADEHIVLDDLKRATKVIARTLHELLAAP